MQVMRVVGKQTAIGKTMALGQGMRRLQGDGGSRLQR
jgi:hypothetical protein